ncbi:hypothetical protein [Bordetella bronchialis]|uniref:Uncharacterized protein n=1 Tax=Bordetella bronchialis TaxID=463025 RepID=A0A193FV91_9BORD|nr:hypothetical protein [Bordetella bronchialis]ANN66172.1 hypothetical protein BAU06_07605 [Bordetella bronchialis]ANN71253.1 hypothetical protein BAU08_07835 [Bordetella bronchialis]
MTRDKAKHSGQDKDPNHPGDKVPTYQEALDEAVEETFPASDPISPGVAEKADREVSTPKDDVDWKASHDKRGEQGKDAGRKK